jgi:putative folate metabolism gamma-glutamate ligase
MQIVPIKTHKITEKDTDIFNVLDTYINNLEDGSIVVVTSKIVSICEGSIRKINDSTEAVDKEELVKEESEYFIDKSENSYGMFLTITQNLLIPTAGIDESNGNGYFILWPKDAYRSANLIREHLVEKFGVQNIGVIITDSKTTPLRWGTTGVAIAHSGFEALKDYIGKPDLFDRQIRVTKSNIADGLAAGAVAVMGEGLEQTPLAVISDISNIKFTNHNATENEIKEFKISLDEDIYSPILKLAPWKKGKKNE